MKLALIRILKRRIAYIEQFFFKVTNKKERGQNNILNDFSKIQTEYPKTSKIQKYIYHIDYE